MSVRTVFADNKDGESCSSVRFFSDKDMNLLEEHVLFCPLPEGGHRWGSFTTSFSVQAGALTLLCLITLSSPQLVQKHFQHIELVSPTRVVEPVKQAARTPMVVKPKPMLRARAETVTAPKILAPPPAVLKHDIAMNVPMPVPVRRFETFESPAPVARVERPVQTNVFAGSSATPTLPKMAASKVQTGGFGDPNGVPANPGAKGSGNIAVVGSFDLPQGPGYGNGTGGSRGARGVIAGSGFGNGVAEAPRRSVQGTVQVAKFDPEPVVETKKAPKEVKPAMLPVAIQDKPNPVYTAEARKLHVEGEVLLQVMFTASGQVKVLRVLRGLGHGLDEAAMRAAEKIRFSPAQREGQPVDSTATLHIVFQLS